ncbi:sensor histidine kinase [Oxalobacteraceae bacterium A2-2]
MKRDSLDPQLELDPDGTALLWHPLDTIPLFRRWRPSRMRNVLYTALWSTGVSVMLALASMLTDRSHQGFLPHWIPMLLISNLIGFLIHGGSVLLNRVLRSRPRQASGRQRRLYGAVLVAVSVVLGIVLGTAILRGRSPLAILQNSGALTVTLLFAVGIGLFMTLVHVASEHRIAREILEARGKEQAAVTAALLSEARLRALQAQIEPHFLYNTLANVLSLIGPQPERAQHMLERFIAYLRASLAASREERSTLGAEARLIAAYLDVLAVRMGDRLRYRIELPDELRQVPIAPMLLQPIVENAIAHGLEPKVEGGEVALTVGRQDSRLRIEVSDTGVGLDGAPVKSAKPGGGVGLSNLRERLASLYGGAAQVQLLENQPSGMIVRLLLPLNEVPTSNPYAP